VVVLCLGMQYAVFMRVSGNVVGDTTICAVLKGNGTVG
jgi:hypothetical protein